MSQQINLILPELRPRFDWLGLPMVAGTMLAALLLVVVLAGLSTLQTERLKTRESALKVQLLSLQQQLQSLGQTLGARKTDPLLEKRIAETRLAVVQRQEVLSAVAQGQIAGGNGYSSLFQGFSRQIVDGVWLVGFGLAGKEIEIRGRLLEPARLPVYMGRLNAEPAFAGRRFAALDMKGIEPAAAVPSETPALAIQTRRLPRYTEFVLRTERERAQ